MPLYLNDSRARKEFKKNLGGTNHLIITCLVGLNAIEKGEIDTVPDELRVAWNPKSPSTSAKRSRRLILDMAIVRAIDALDIYIKLSRNNYYLIQKPELYKAIDGCGTSIADKVETMSNYYNELDNRLVVFIKILIAWRNKAAHTDIGKEVAPSLWNELLKHQDWSREEFSGLEIKKLKKNFESGNPASVKETLSLINATQKLVENLESIQFSHLDAKEFLTKLVRHELRGDTGQKKEKDKILHERIQSIWGRNSIRTEKALIRTLEYLGLSKEKKYDTSLLFKDELFIEISQYSVPEAYAWLTPCSNNINGDG